MDVIPPHGLQPFMADSQPRMQEGTMHLRQVGEQGLAGDIG
jgi:hypothetical protein